MPVPRPFRRWTFVSAGVALLACAALVAAPAASSTQTRASDIPVPPACQQPKNDKQLDICGTTVTGPGVSLADGYLTHGSTTNRVIVAPSATVKASSYNQWLVGGAWPSATVNYNLVGTDGKPTNQWVSAYFYVPFVGSNEHSCVVRNGRPDTGAPAAPAADYTCRWTNVSGYNPSPVLTITRATVVTDHAAQQRLLSQCNVKSNNCVYGNLPPEPVLYKGPEQIKAVLTNNGTKVNTLEKTVVAETTTTQNVHFTAGIEAGLTDKFKVSFSTTYGYGWSTTHSDQESAKVKVPPGWKGWVTFTPNLQTVTGDFLVTDRPSGDYVSSSVPDATFTGPNVVNGMAGVWGARDCQMVSAQDERCVAGTEKPVAVTVQP